MRQVRLEFLQATGHSGVHVVWLLATVDGKRARRQLNLTDRDLEELRTPDLCQAIMLGCEGYMPLRVLAVLMYGLTVLHREQISKLFDRTRDTLRAVRDGSDITQRASVARRHKRQTVLRPSQNFAIEFGLMPPYIGTPPPPEVGLSSTVRPWLGEDATEVLSDTEPNVDDLLGYAMFPDEPSPPLPELELDMGGSEPYIPDELSLQFEPEFSQPLPGAPPGTLPGALPDDRANTGRDVPGEGHGQGPSSDKDAAPVKPKHLRYDKDGCLIQTDDETDESYVSRMADLRALKEKRRRLDRQGASQVVLESMGPVLRVLESISPSDPPSEGTGVSPAFPFEEPQQPSQFPTTEPATGRPTRASSVSSIEHLRHASERLSSRASSRGLRSPLGDLPWYDDYGDAGEDYDDFLNLDSLGGLSSGEMSDSQQRSADIAPEHYDCLKRLQNMNCSEVAFPDMLETKCRAHAARAFMDLLWLANNSYVAMRQDPTSAQIIIKQTRPAS